MENGFVELMLVENLPNRFTRNSIDYNKVDNDLLGTTEKTFCSSFLANLESSRQLTLLLVLLYVQQ